MVNDVFHDRDASCAATHLLDAGQWPAFHRGQGATMQAVAGQLLELFRGCHVHGNVGAPTLVDACEGFRHASDPRFFDKQGNRFPVGGQRAIDDFRRFRDEQALAGFKLVAKLDFREIRVCRHALVVNGIKMDELHVIDLSPNSCQIQENPLFPRGLLVSGAGLEPARLYK